MSTRYVSHAELLDLLRDSDDPLAQRAIAALDPVSVELIPIHDGSLDRPTYEVRLARAEAGEGPRNEGLARFVHALDQQDNPEHTGFRDANGTQFLLLLDGGRVVAITAVYPS